MWVNKIMIPLLRSPLHGLVSKSMMTVSYTGRKSGKTFTVPVNYVADGNTLYTISNRDRVWWRNVRDGATVTLQLRGQSVSATGTVIEQQEATAVALQTLISLKPSYARFLNVELGDDGRYTTDSLTHAAQERVVVCFQL